ncbi:MAG: hypothetical protein A2030_11630 [Chloroflexi bacterium RBG_19FT_COMBO_50_10]|nr:MAG: hypothetical protein A2030_11630 [Chloroflexi bacterium RBG_19FT_COMBO_50_10]
MEINPLGLISAVTAFLSIWIGHVSVRKIEAITVNLWKPMVIAIALGLTLEYAAISISNRPLSTVCGILGITLLWDALEIKWQTHRIRKGRAPANPNNPRHAAMLVEPNTRATTLNLLDRDPMGRAVDMNEAIKLVTNH